MEFLVLTVRVAVVTSAILLSATASATEHTSRPPAYLQSDARPCSFFQLIDVPEADPVAPNNPWFALPESNPAYHDMFAELLSAQLAGKPVDVWTDGSLSCGYPTATRIQIDL